MNATKLGVVVIGRNEGERLRRCLRSLERTDARVYVDSGSADGSQELARAMGFDLVELDSKDGFTAARARNAGIQRLGELSRELEYVQFVDGDCEVREGWSQEALINLPADVAVVFGRRREIHPEKNIYHRACDIEWMVPAGFVNSCGGDALFRFDALRQVGGYNPSLIAGEEPDLCLRLRQNGWRVFSNNKEMTRHDVAIDRFGQWWQRAKRAGFAFAELVDLHASKADSAWKRLLASAAAWSVVALLSLASFLLYISSRNSLILALSLGLIILLSCSVVRTAWRRRPDFDRPLHALGWSALLFVSKFAQAQGMLVYLAQRRLRHQPRLIEYK